AFLSLSLASLDSSLVRGSQSTPQLLKKIQKILYIRRAVCLQTAVCQVILNQFSTVFPQREGFCFTDNFSNFKQGECSRLSLIRHFVTPSPKGKALGNRFLP
ncbi:MAG: hypothetical protein U0L17_04960, partial [Acutalibacteraceae bacterium]|nr:hypothetical protein [Acutalibacteraceae bacterium]